jgi:hypothetical protein
LLDEMSDLRKRTRRSRHGYWFPLLLLGLLVLGSLPLHSPHPAEFATYETCLGERIPPNGCQLDLPSTRITLPLIGDVDPVAMFNSGFIATVAHPLGLALYWLAALVVGLLATVRWYRWRAGKVGVESPTRAYSQVTIGGLGVLLGIPVVGALGANKLDQVLALDLLPGKSGRVVGALLFLVAGLAAVVLATRLLDPDSTPSPRRRLLDRGYLFLALLGVALVGVIGIHKVGGLWLIAGGLLVLALLERSVFCAVVAVVFTGLTMLADGSYLGTIFWHLGWEIGPPQTNPLFLGKDVVLPGVVLIGGGLLALAMRWRTGREGVQK